ncbi:MAG: nucleotidyltransferase family protein [Mariprofundaceae bacterium]
MSRVNRAVILAAGLGTRLKWLTSNSPKAMMSIDGEPAIVQVIRRLAGQGIHDIAINVHHHAAKLIDYLGDGSGFGVRLYFSHESSLLDSGGGVRKAMDLLPGSGLILVHNSDVVADIDLQKLAHSVMTCADGSGAALALVPNPAHHPDGDFGITEGMVSLNRKPGFTYSGVSVWDEGSFSDYQSGETFPLTAPMKSLISQKKLSAVMHRGVWFDIGRPRDLMQARLAANSR